MKKQLKKVALVSILLVSGLTIAQEKEEAQTLFGGESSIKKENIGFFVAPSFGISAMDGSATSLLNLRGGISFGDQLSLGASFNSSMNEIRPESETIQDIYMDFWSFGGFAEFTVFSKKMIHFSIPLQINYGEIEMDNYQGDAGLGEASFIQIEPSALLEVNLHKYVRLNLGAGYRLISQVTYRNLNQNDLSGLTGYVGLKFGLFR
jgi:hypothetical protein